jgi:PST family polysaccharide transporter
MRRLREHGLYKGLLQSVAALYGVQACRKLIPLVSIPYLTRELGPEQWGRMAVVWSLAEIVVIVLEFGFNLSATRDISRSRESVEECRRISSGVIGAKIILGLVSSTIMAATLFALPDLRNEPKLIMAGYFYAICQGLNPVWLLQGLNRIGMTAALEIAGKLLGLLGMLLWVRRSEDVWIAMGMQGVAPLVSLVIGSAIAHRAIGWAAPTVVSTRAALARGWPLFVFRSAEGLYGVGNAFILGLLGPAVQVGYFASSQKITKAVFGLLNPIQDALFPNINNSASNEPHKAATLLRLGMGAMIASGVLLSAALWVCANWITRVLLGKAFEPAADSIRVLALLPTLLAITYSIGMQSLLAAGMDRLVNRIIISAGVINLCLACLLARRFGHVGMAWSLVCTETFVAAAMTVSAFRYSPLLNRAGQPDYLAAVRGVE